MLRIFFIVLLINISKIQACEDYFIKKALVVSSNSSDRANHIREKETNKFLDEDLISKKQAKEIYDFFQKINHILWKKLKKIKIY